MEDKEIQQLLSKQLEERKLHINREGNSKKKLILNMKQRDKLGVPILYSLPIICVRIPRTWNRALFGSLSILVSVFLWSLGRSVVDNNIIGASEMLNNFGCIVKLFCFCNIGLLTFAPNIVFALPIAIRLSLLISYLFLYRFCT